MTTRRPLKALVVEDVPEDAELLVRELHRSGFDVTWKRVDDAQGLSSALDERWDIVFSDWNMPGFNARAALAILRGRFADVPFVIVSGTVQEEIAVEAMHAGAQDFVFKGKLLRLGAAVERELAEVAVRAERKSLEEQLLLSDRMVSVGTLAAGVAHEINNPLAALMANVEYATQELARIASALAQLEPPIPIALQEGIQAVGEALGDATESAERVRLIVRDVKVFSRPDEERRGPVNVHRVLESTTRMCWNEIRHRARLVKDFGPIATVDANEARLGQVFLNLVVNATQAIPDGKADDHEIRIGTWMNDRRQVVVEVRDTGAGIPPEIQRRVFDPFFTTKPVGMGTGLGLAISHRIIVALGGTIEVDSEPGHGTSFRVVLPEGTMVAENAPARGLQPSPVEGPGARVLVVDDEPSVRTVVRRALGDRHVVVGVANGREALARIANGEVFDVILCDLNMPQMTGMDLHARLLASHPQQAERLIFMTGGVFTDRARAFIHDGSHRTIDKPFDLVLLRALVDAKPAV